MLNLVYVRGWIVLLGAGLVSVSELEQEDKIDVKELPFIAPTNRLDTGAPFRWLAAGWGDFRRAPLQSLAYGLIMTLIAVLVAGSALKTGAVVMGIVVMAGFGFLMPVLAMGVYSISCQLERGQKPVMWNCIRQGGRHIGNAAIFAFALLIVFLLWARASSAVHIFFPDHGLHSTADYLIFGGSVSVIALLFSSIIFSISAFSIPMIMDRNVDAITAMLTSVSAVRRNKKVVLLWYLLIVGSTGLAFALGVVGLVIVLPVLGHATWHGYHEVVLADAWPQQPDTVV